MPRIWRFFVKPAFPFLDLTDGGRTVPILFDGMELTLPEGRNLAAALLAAGFHSFRSTPVSGAPRGPFCMMGACFDCLVEVNGIRRQACMMEVVEGMEIQADHGITSQ